MKKPELLAPAGSMEALIAALRCGADAVYIGGKSFSARQNAENFDREEIKEAAELCHLYGKKLYMTLNTVIFDSQVSDFAKAAEQSMTAGVDAFIVQDWGAAEIIKSISSDAKLHGSTQMTVHSPAGAITAKKLGCKRVVLSRELSEKQIKEISDLDIETEIFVHGALCMSVSGQCYLSAVIGQRSANRGLCAQPCRLPFSAVGNSHYCGLSLKDLSLAEHINSITQAGVSSLKIEGRMKRPEYVAAAVHTFRNAIDGKPYDRDMLKAVFSRSGFTDGYFTGKLEKMFGTREKEDVISAKEVFPKVHSLYRTERKSAEINFTVCIKADSPTKLTVSDNDGNSADVYGDTPQKAVNRETDHIFIEKQLSRLGGTVYNYGGTTSDIDKGLSISAREINSLRRNAVEALSLKRTAENTPVYNISRQFPEITDKKRALTEIRAQISDISQLRAVQNADRIIIPAGLISGLESEDMDKIIVKPPRFITDETKTINMLAEIKRMGINRLLCSNIAYLHIGKNLGFTLHGDFGLNAANSYSTNTLAALGLTDITLSFELKASQAAALRSPVPTGIIGYGRLPVMLTRNCPVKNEVGCGKCGKKIIDRTGKAFPILCHGDYVEILNSQRLYIADKLDDFKNISFMTLCFTDESSEEIAKIIHDYRFGGTKKENITRGLYYRGVL